ncbi:S8 family serine peptidase [Thermoflavimicrobium daqui]|jgi:subtilisin family serine protease|uniref:Peptidase S8/S53 domain-containing protein n=1 Tax=Thermoflavimicrobium daqui TaxID=2137476 RepID=A0A364K8Q4_9BACL|nr:S8 family serine peptidase [Thermoflavimicrobium daqui]RAL26677.1 hypothetical protein DL897_01095 [Thermoflavimicrobium daqui]
MKKWFTLITVIILCFSLFTFSPRSTAQSNEKQVHSQLIVFQENTSIRFDEVQKSITEQYPVSIQSIPEVAIIKLSSNNQDQLQAAIQFAQKQYGSEIKAVGEDQIVSPPPIPAQLFTSQDPDAQLQSIKPISKVNPTQVDLTKADLYQKWGWDIQKVTENGQSYRKEAGNHQVKVAVIDSGFDFNHPDLKNNIVSQGKSFVPDVTDTLDRMGHGTMVAGGIAANGRLLGVGPELGLVPYKVFHQGGGESSWVIQAMIQAAKDGVDVINLSLGTFKSLHKPEDIAIIQAYQRAVHFAAKKGVITVGAIGNEGFDLSDPKEVAEKLGNPGDEMIQLPSELHSVVAVSGTTKEDTRSSQSSYGIQVDLAAPSGDFHLDNINVNEMVLTTLPTYFPLSPINQAYDIPQGYTFMSGTSLAVSKVSGAAGVLIARYKERHHGKSPNPNYIKQILRHSASDLGDLGKDNQFGHGLVNVNRGLNLVR